MLKQRLDGVYQSDILLSVAGTAHGYSSRNHGDMRKSKNRKSFLHRLNLDPTHLVSAEQIHGNTIRVVTNKDIGKEIPNADGLVYRREKENVSLAVRVADCVPILAVDPETFVIGVAHAGWKGTLGNIASNLIATMNSQGAVSSTILISIGPHIGMCCYSVASERAHQFAGMFNNDPRIISYREGAPHLDIGYANVRQLQEAGISADHIDAAITCTSCQVDTYYSYRKDTKETFGEIIGVIGFTS